MKVIVGATGRVGGRAARALLARREPVRVLTRGEEDARAWRERGADAVRVALDDAEALGGALRGATGLFTMLPFVEDAGPIIAAQAAAIRAAEVEHVVMLSSVGADLESGTGPIVDLHRMEQELLATGTTLTAMRSGHFQEKIADLLPTVRDHGVYPVLADSADRSLPMVATRDLGELAAELLLHGAEGSEVVDVIGPECTEREAAGILARALKRTVEVQVIERARWVASLVSAGEPEPLAHVLAELAAADADGLMQPRGDRRVQVTTPLAETVAGLLRTSR